MLSARKKTFLVFLVIVFIFLVLNAIFLFTFNHIPLKGDAPGFVSLAKNMSNFYAASEREPFWILWVKIWISVFKNPALGMRIGCIVLYIFSSYFIFLILGKILNAASAIIGTFFYLLIPYMFFSHIRAHRLELYLFLLLFFCFWMLFKMTSRWNAVFCGVIVSALVLTRMEALSIVFLGFLYYVFFSKGFFKEKVLKILISSVVLIVLSGPFFLNCLVKKGSAFYVLNVHSRFWDSHEHAGQPGFRSPDVVLKKPYEGRKMTVFKYIFSNRKPTGIVLRFLKGYEKALIRGVRHLLEVPFNLRFLVYFVWLGFLLMPFSKKGLTLLFWGLLFIFPHSFILPLHVVGKPSVDIRFAASSVPLMAFSFAFLVFVFEKLLTVSLRFAKKRV